MFLEEYIDVNVFLIALSIGLLYTYIVVPRPEIIIKYPTPYNVGKIKYMDEAGTCYKYTIEQTSCPYNKKEIKQFKPSTISNK